MDPSSGQSKNYPQTQTEAEVGKQVRRLPPADAGALPRKTARWSVVQELKRRGTARNVEIARALDLRPSTVGYILHQLRVSGCARRIRTGLYEFVRMPENLHYWDDGIPAGQEPQPEGDTMPEQVLSLLRSAPNGALSFGALWKLSGLPRNVTGAVLSDLVKRGLVDRVRRGLYKAADMPSGAGTG